MSDCVPIDLVTLILSNLDVPTLLRCRSVSKEWRSLIDSPRFIKTHVNQSLKSNKNNTLFLQEDDGPLFSFNFDCLYPCASLHGLKQQQGSSLIGSCNGLLCLSNEEEEDIRIFNPATKKCKKIPAFVQYKFNLIGRFAPDGASVKGTGFGFGYDSVAGDYKVVRIVHSIGKDLNYQESDVIIYSVMKDLWRRIKMPYVVRFMRYMGVFVGGALHWLAGRFDDTYGPTLIVAFDLGVDEFRVVPQPDYVGGRAHGINIGVLGDCLCVFAKFEDEAVDVWVMKEYGVKESWSKVFSIPSNLLSYGSVKPLGYSREGKAVLLDFDDYRLVWYEIEKKEAVEIVINGMKGKFFETTLCLNSLVRPDDNGGIFISQQPPKGLIKKNSKKKKRIDTRIVMPKFNALDI